MNIHEGFPIADLDQPTNFSSFSPQAVSVMRARGILLEREPPKSMAERVSSNLAHFGGSTLSPEEDEEEFRADLKRLILEQKGMPGSTILTNAGRNNLLCSAVAFPKPVFESNYDREIFQKYVRSNIGIGFNLDHLNDPVPILHWLDALAQEEEVKGNVSRPISLMATRSWNRPNFYKFLDAKLDTRQLQHFNLSVILSNTFLQSLDYDGYLIENTGSSWEKISPKDLFNRIVENAWENGEPGVIFENRFNMWSHPRGELYNRITTPPCGDMAWEEGDCAHFGTINLPAHVNGDTIDYDSISKSTKILTRALDNAVEISSGNHPVLLSNWKMRAQRKISIGVCGLADIFEKLQISYGSEDSIRIAQNIISLITYTSKETSYQLSLNRGSCDALQKSSNNIDFFPVIYKYIQFPTDTVSEQMWTELADRISNNNLLRNLTTTSQPPTSVVSIICNSSPAIDPIPGRQVSMDDQFNVAARLAHFYDEGISRTIISKHDASIEDINYILRRAGDTTDWEGVRGKTVFLKGLTVFREGSRR